MLDFHLPAPNKLNYSMITQSFVIRYIYMFRNRHKLCLLLDSSMLININIQQTCRNKVKAIKKQVLNSFLFIGIKTVMLDTFGKINVTAG